MDENDIKIVRVRNIFDFDFTGELGARFGGRDFVIPAGKSLLAPLSVGKHLATHLARQSIIRKSPIRDDKEVDGRGKDRPLWDDASIEHIVALILSDEFEEEKTRPLSEADRLVQKVEELNAGFPANEEAEAPAPEPASYKDKAEVIAELKKRGIAFNARLSKANLEKLLTD